MFFQLIQRNVFANLNITIISNGGFVECAGELARGVACFIVIRSYAITNEAVRRGIFFKHINVAVR